MNELRIDEFSAYFAEVHGTEPFPWQRRLAEQVHEEGVWPRLLDLPTGTGKTAALDVAVFLLALEAGAPERKAPLRMVFTVDRRTIVDQAHERGVRIRNALNAASGGVLLRVRERLASFTRTRTPLQVVALRGGIARDDAWARSPDQPLIAVTTVDQVGSRMLFRGYGVSESMRPVHAGLLGNDCLFLLDEVHLSVPFKETLRALDVYRTWAKSPIGSRWHVVEMSATSDQTNGGFRLDARDRSHPVLQTRLAAPRPVRIETVKVSGSESKRRDALARRAVEICREEVRPGLRLAVVVNRVQTARRTYEQLHAEHHDRADVLLVTGRMRPLDREELERSLRSKVAVAAPRLPDAKPTIVVSTQCIEAGADFDFDVLISECASIDALRQRFGRLNRQGTSAAAKGWVLCRSDSLAEDANDPVYGPALRETGLWLLDQGETVDFGLEAMSKRLGSDFGALLPARDRAPLLLPAHLDLWAQTKPTPAADPEVALWLHGVRPVRPEVQVIWRADLDEEELVAALTDDERQTALVERVQLSPPSALEALAVPLHAVQRWLEGDPHEEEVADVEGMRLLDDEPTASARPERVRPFIVWRGDEESLVANEARGVRPGQTLIVPASYGGLEKGTWSAEASSSVRDLGDVAGVRMGRATLRLHRSVIAGWEGADRLPPAPAPNELAPEEVDEAVQAWLGAFRELNDDARALATQLLREARSRRGLRIIRQGDDAHAYFVLSGRGRLAGSAEVSTEDDTASFSGVAVSLERHLSGVGEVARDFVAACGLPAEVASDVVLAAAWHDLGKADPRFQQILRGGSRFAVEVAAELLAKSSLPPADARARNEARRSSAYPRGCRHELQSVSLLQSSSAIRERAHDWDLVLHLVGSHHGHCRPFAPVALDREPVDVQVTMNGAEFRSSSAHGLERLDSGVTDRFWRLVRKYGWHGLAWLESIVRLADHRRSAEEQDEEHGHD